MTYTYTVTAPYTDLARVRFETRDNKGSTTAMFSDEEIAFQISEKGSWQAAVISLLEAKISEIGDQPDYTAQWLSVKYATTLAALESLLNRKRQEYGIAGIRATTGFAWRPDSAQTEAPTFPDATTDGDDD